MKKKHCYTTAGTIAETKGNSQVLGREELLGRVMERILLASVVTNPSSSLPRAIIPQSAGQDRFVLVIGWSLDPGDIQVT
jgi:hypothetical protein